MKITKHAQSCFLIEANGQRILVDPGSFVFNEEGLKPDDFQNIDIIAITHEHFDHFDIENIGIIIEQNDPKIIGVIPVIQSIIEKYPDADAKPLLDGQEFNFEGIKIKGFHSKHGPLPTGRPAPEVMGMVVDDSKTSFYAPGDSLYLNRQAKADIIAVPICGEVVMDIEEAKKELMEMRPKLAIPIHYDNPRFPVKVEDFVRAMGGSNLEVRVLGWGESVEK